MLVPKNRAISPELLMEQLFRTTELEVRLSLNMNVLDAAGIPRVMSLAEVLQAYLAHRMVVLVRRSRHRLAKVLDRLEVLEGYLKAFLDLDEVIRIIREEDEPKPALMARFELTDRQAEAILNLRLRNLRKLEEMELKGERDRLVLERQGLEELLADEGRAAARLKEEFLAAKKQFGGGPLGKRRTELRRGAGDRARAARGAGRAVPGHRDLLQAGLDPGRARGGRERRPSIKYKEGDGERFLLPAQSSDRLLVIAADGRVYTLAVDRLASGRGHGEPLSLAIDLDKGVEIRRPARSPPGRPAGVRDPQGLRLHRRGEGDRGPDPGRPAGRQPERRRHAAGGRAGRRRPLALAGTNRKLLIFPLAELPVQARGKGVTLMRLKDAELADLKTLDAAQGLTWIANGKERRERDLTAWRGLRAGSGGASAPRGFPKNNRFS